MSDVVIRAEGLSKKYLIGLQQQERYAALRDVLARGTKRLGRKLLSPFTAHRSPFTGSQEEFLALTEVSFEIRQGDRVGIIGRNGAGKSTLLKILSRITEPTSGRAEITGRVASLLEVGTGFHPELTGRENIYLNGAILGMSKAEIKRKFDEIVSFAEIEKFLDTPVKRYSSGMYVRLAFAVAAHLEPEILIVDEVLAVGDAAFQKKCLGKMEEVGKEGRTVLFVSHNMAAIRSLCSSAIILNAGKIIGQGNVEAQIPLYLKLIGEISKNNTCSKLKLNDDIELKRFDIAPNPIESGNDLTYCIELASNKSITFDSIVILIYSMLGIRVGIVDLRQYGSKHMVDSDKMLTIKGKIKSLPLVEGDYSVGLFLASAELTNNFYDLSNLSVINSPIEEMDVLPYPSSVRGFVEFDFDIDCKFEAD